MQHMAVLRYDSWDLARHVAPACQMSGASDGYPPAEGVDSCSLVHVHTQQSESASLHVMCLSRTYNKQAVATHVHAISRQRTPYVGASV